MRNQTIYDFLGVLAPCFIYVLVKIVPLIYAPYLTVAALQQKMPSLNPTWIQYVNDHRVGLCTTAIEEKNIEDEGYWDKVQGSWRTRMASKTQVGTAGKAAGELTYWPTRHTKSLYHRKIITPPARFRQLCSAASSLTAVILFESAKGYMITFLKGGLPRLRLVQLRQILVGMILLAPYILLTIGSLSTKIRQLYYHSAVIARQCIAYQLGHDARLPTLTLRYKEIKRRFITLVYSIPNELLSACHKASSVGLVFHEVSTLLYTNRLIQCVARLLIWNYRKLRSKFMSTCPDVVPVAQYIRSPRFDNQHHWHTRLLLPILFLRIPSALAAERESSLEDKAIAVSTTNVNESGSLSEWSRLFGNHPLSPDGLLFMAFGFLFICLVKWLIAKKKIDKLWSRRWLMAVSAYLSSAALIRKSSPSTVVITWVYFKCFASIFAKGTIVLFP